MKYRNEIEMGKYKQVQASKRGQGRVTSND